MRKRSKNKIILRQSSHCEETGLFMRALRAKSCLAFVLFLSALIGQAQGNVASPNTAGLDSAVEKLKAITLLPLPQWRVKDDAGFRGELASVDDSAWATSPAGQASEWSTGPRWFRDTVEIPAKLNGYDVRNMEVRFRVRIYGENPVLLRIFQDGKQIAIGNDLDPVVIADHAQPGQKILIAIHGEVPGGRTGLYAAQLEFYAAPGRPDARLLMQELDSANRVLGGNPNPQGRKQVEASVAALDWSTLERGDQASFDASVRKAQAQLDPAREWLSKYTIHATGNSHIDMAWLWPWTETVGIVHDTFHTVLALMREYPEFTFTHGSAVTYEWMEEKYPKMFAEIKERVKEGRWEPMGGMWVEPDLNMPDGESIVRQLLVGKTYFRNKFAVDVRTGWNPDSFGYNAQLPQIYKKSGMDTFVTQKIYWNDTTRFPLKIFWWESPDGSRILGYLPHNYGNPIEPVDMAQDLSDYTRLTGYPELLHLYGVGDHGGGPTRSMLETATRWEQKDLVYPRLEVGAAQPFFDKLFQAAPKLNLPVWKSELYLEYHRGVYTSQARTKWNNRRNEEMLLNTEKFSSIASLYGANYPAEDLNYGWKKVLFNQFHDILSGSSVAAVYKDADRDHADVRRLETKNLQDALNAIEGRVNTTGPGVAVVVFNPLAWDRTAPVEWEASFPSLVKDVEVRDAGGKVVASQLLGKIERNARVLFMADIPALGYQVFHFVPTTATRKAADVAGDTQIENELLRVKVDPKTGCMSLFDKRNQREAFEAGKCGNLLQAFYDLPHEYDAWNIDANFEDKKWDIDKAEDVKVTERGPVRSTIRVVRRFQNSTFVQDVRIYPGVDQVEVVNNVDWHEKHILVKAAFPLPVRNENATYEIPYGAIGRPTGRRNAFEKARFEVPALRWADLSDAQYGVSILNDSKYGYDGKDNVLRLSLLRSPAYPDPHADEGKQHFSYAIYPHAAGWQQANTVRHGYEFNYLPIAFQTTAHDGSLPPSHSFVKIEPANLVLTALKQSEAGDGVVLRFYESSGQAGTARIQFPAGVREGREVSLMEKQEGAIAGAGNEITVSFGAWEIKTLWLPHAAAPIPTGSH